MATRAVAQTVCFVAWDTTNNVGKTGDGANFTMRWVKDGTSSALTVTTVTEIDSTNVPGLYKVGISSTESDCNIGYLGGKSSTSAISIMPVKVEFERLPDAVPGAAGGIFIAGTNAACTITGNFAIQGGITVTQSSSNTPAIIATGNGTGQGARFAGGSGAAGVDISAGASSSAAGMSIAGGASGTGFGLSIVGGGTSGAGISVTTTSGDGVSILPTAGNGIVATGQGTSKHGLIVTGSSSGTGDGLKAVAGAGGVAYRGTLERCTLVDTTTTNTDMRGTNSAFLAASAPTNFSSLGINASGHLSRVTLCDTTTTNTDMRGTDSAFLAASAPANFSSLGINASGHISRVTLADTITTYTGNTVQTGDSFGRIGATGSGLTSLAPSTLLTTALTESYAADGATFTVAQALYMLWACTSQFDVSSTTITMRKLDGTTSAGTFTMDSATSPTSRTRAS